MFPILKKKIEFALGLTCLYLVCAFAVQISVPAEADSAREPITTINLTAHMDAYDVADGTFDKAALESIASTEAHKMMNNGDIDQYEDRLRESGMLSW